MLHRAYLSLGSNIQPEINLPNAVELLREYGEIRKISSAWEFEAVGSEGPNYLNACVLFQTPLHFSNLKEQIIHPIEARLGRIRTEDKFASRTIDIDVIVYDNESSNEKFWKLAYVVIPLAEIYPTFQNPITREPISETAARMRQSIWMELHSEVLSRSYGS